MPTTLEASSSAGTAFSLGFSYLGNLNVSTITNNRDTGRTETFTYDELNRLSSAQSQATSGPDCWGQTMPASNATPPGYDRYGNLRTINSSQCSTPGLSLSVNNYNHIALVLDPCGGLLLFAMSMVRGRSLERAHGWSTSLLEDSHENSPRCYFHLECALDHLLGRFGSP